jgi:hypothetical protein
VDVHVIQFTGFDTPSNCLFGVALAEPGGIADLGPGAWGLAFDQAKAAARPKSF